MILIWGVNNWDAGNHYGYIGYSPTAYGMASALGASASAFMPSASTTPAIPAASASAPALVAQGSSPTPMGSAFSSVPGVR